MTAPATDLSRAPAELPRHIAIIMDGNGRWAKRRFLPRFAGHRQGAEAVRRVVTACIERGISYLTLYAFSSENWKRPPEEVEDLMGLLRHYLNAEIAELDRQNVRIRFIGERDRLAGDVQTLTDDAERKTAKNTGLTLVIALNYGAQAELARAAREIACAAREGRIDPEAVDEAMLASHLLTRDIPDPDLVIRTSGEKRLSNFLLWQSAYAELMFLDALWPDFDAGCLDAAIVEYQCRQRRYGGI